MNPINSTWTNLLRHILHIGAPVWPRGEETRELLGIESTFSLRNPVLTVLDRKLNYRFMAAEALWILRGSNRVSELTPYIKGYGKYAQDGRHVQWAYGPKVTEQLCYVVETLIADPQSRQAVLSIWRENPRYTPPCTMTMQFLIRDHSGFNCITNMRSSDTWMGYPYDAFTFSMIAIYVLLLLKDKSPRLFSTIPLGWMHINAGSQHLYRQHWIQATDCIHSDNILEIKDMDIYGLISPDDLLFHLECLRDAAFDGMTCEFFKQLEPLLTNKNEPTTSTTADGGIVSSP